MANEDWCAVEDVAGVEAVRDLTFAMPSPPGRGVVGYVFKWTGGDQRGEQWVPVTETSVTVSGIEFGTLYSISWTPVFSTP